MPRTAGGGYSLETLGDMIDFRFSLTVYCEQGRGCHHWKRIDIPALAERVGRQYRCDHHTLCRLRWLCTACGGRAVSFRMASTKGDDFYRTQGRKPAAT